MALATWDADQAPYLALNPPLRRQFFAPRRGGATPRLGVVHTAENTPDNLGPDTGAEAVANFIARRSGPGSYHVIADSDSIVRLGADDWEMFGTGSPSGANRWCLHLSMACQARHWAQIPTDRRRWYGLNAALVGAHWSAVHDIELRPVTLAEAEDIVAGRTDRTGWCRHGDLDHPRRSDPGWSDDEFDAWLAACRDINTQTEESDMATWFVEIDPQPGSLGRRSGWVCREGHPIEPVNGAPPAPFVLGTIVHVREDTGHVLTTEGDYGMGGWAIEQGLGHHPVGGAAVALSDADIERIADAVGRGLNLTLDGQVTGRLS